jgi:hypothetical protein
MHRCIFFFLISILLFSASTLAQLKVGFKAGALASSVSDGGIGLASGSQVDTKFSYLLGGVFALPVYKKGKLQAEILYSNEGYRVEGTGSEVIRDHLHYLSLPFLLQHEIARGLSVGAGTEISFLLAAHQQITNDSGYPSGPLDWYRLFELGINLNFQYLLLEQLAVGLRYNIGLSDITENIELPVFGGGTTVIDSDVYNRSLHLSLMYWLK